MNRSLFASLRGRLLPMITIFAQKQDDQPGIRIWNSQLIRFAGYEQSDGSVMIALLISAVSVGLMIASGVGYLGQKNIAPLMVPSADHAPTMSLFEQNLRKARAANTSAWGPSGKPSIPAVTTTRAYETCWGKPSLR